MSIEKESLLPISRPRGVNDIFPPVSFIYHKVYQISTEILHSNNYQPIILPTLEYEKLFTSSLSNETDIIAKEMYCFLDKKGRRLSLRPEGTICVARLFCQNKLLKIGWPSKFYYWANMFRYERPQKGRSREFWQLGIELINADGIQADYQILKLANDILVALNIDKFTFQINYLGGKETKEFYKKILKQHILENKVNLCDICKYRMNINPLRILDCLHCAKTSNCPSYDIAWNEEDKKYINSLGGLLSESSFPYQFDYTLVRGLDYYTGIVFEINLETGSNKAILGGGRYNNLYKRLSQIDIPATGFAIGIERLIDYLIEKKKLPVEKKKIRFIFFGSWWFLL